MTRRSHMDPLRLDGLDAWITREPEPQYDPAMDEPELEPCEVCEATGFVAENAPCPKCGGDRFI